MMRQPPLQSIVVIGMIALATALPASSETFQQGNTAFRTPDGKWMKARIEVSSEKVEVFHRKLGTLVAQFDRANPERPKYLQTTEVYRRVGRGVVFGVVSGVVLAGVNIGIRAALDAVDEELTDEFNGHNGIGADSFEDETQEIREKLPLATLIAGGALGAIAILRGMGKGERQRRQITQGTSKVTLRIRRKDLGRFDMALDRFVNP